MSYGYTNNNQLTSVSHTNSSFANESFSYDNNGNRNSTGYTTGTGNRSSSDGTYNYAYDDEGNETLRTNISTGAQTLYKWDYRNRLTEVDSVVSGVNTVLATYTYDALDRRIGVTESGATRWTLYDGNSAVLDFNGSGTQTARYLNGPTAAGVDAVMARETLGGTVAWYLPDRLGTIRDLIDNSGNVIDHIDYGVFGNVQGESSPSNRDGFKYAGMRYDSTIGLYFDQARWYDPTSGRFVSIDPVGFAAGDADLYRYVGNGPTIYFDPSGLSGVSPEQCKKWQEQLQKLQDLLKKEQAKYDPDGDKIGGFPGRHGTTKPGGHAKEMADLQRGIDNLLDKLSRFCGGGSGPKPGSSNPPPSMRARTPDDDVRDQIMSDLRNRPPLVFQCEPGFLLPPVAPPTVVEDPVKGPKGPRYPRTPLRRQRPVGTPMRPVRR